ncbi:type II toxin-antitoxin system RelE/ParE family toxin [Sphingomonas suaedae]|uniref:type II toxin-antitoxin system RelE/ParE family toxin n=1 Tax=Sphingomonas suaedae TaxID=2599297 RepID=UPI0016489D00
MSRRAHRDLAGIWRYGAREWGLEQAFAYADQINRAFDLLRERPNIGSVRVQGGVEYRRWVGGRHAILFRTSVRSLHMVRILHSAMDERRHLG